MPVVTSQRSFHPGVLCVKEASLWQTSLHPPQLLYDCTVVSSSCADLRWTTLPPPVLAPHQSPDAAKGEKLLIWTLRNKIIMHSSINSFWYQCCCTSCFNKSLSVPQPSSMLRCSHIHHMAAPWQMKERCTALPHALLGQGCPSTLYDAPITCKIKGRGDKHNVSAMLSLAAFTVLRELSKVCHQKWDAHVHLNKSNLNTLKHISMLCRGGAMWKEREDGRVRCTSRASLAAPAVTAGHGVDVSPSQLQPEPALELSLALVGYSP